MMTHILATVDRDAAFAAEKKAVSIYNSEFLNPLITFFVGTGKQNKRQERMRKRIRR
jgi:hypothetical protein